ncbi:MAG TPA: NAD(P)-dependent oxidoreductase [Mycobacteriales bacterium]|jgi:D-3-phosphoglycerate dehydrogenase|nr:NAD(P)-dependent oxidoreductase [Mycobacteriales bacterium]
MSAPWRVLALSPAPREMLLGFLGEGDWELAVPQTRTQAAVVEAAAGVELVLGDWTHVLRVDGPVFAAAPDLAFIQQPAAGTDTIDLAGAAALGIPVANTGSANTVAVAEWCVLAAMALLRSTIEADAAVRAGGWPQMSLPMRELAGARVGILGFGRIGQAAARRFAAMDAEVAYWSRTARPEVPHRWAPLPEVLATSEVLISVLPSVPDTRGLLGPDALAAMPTGAVLVSAGRGDVLDESALAAALHAGHLGGAALDVYEREPLPAEAVLRAAPHLLLSPHASGATLQARRNIMLAVQANLGRAVRGQPLVEVVNGAPTVVERRRAR